MTTLVAPKAISPKRSFVSLGAIGFKLFSAVLKIAKSLKFILAAGTFGAYAFMFSWKFALLVMIGIGLHEMGHVWAMRKCGIPTKGFYFIPLIGGAAVADEEFKSGKEEIFVALMGPFVGLLTALVPLIAFGVTGSPFWAAAASWLAMVNLFNLFPINPLDGGRFIKGITFSLNSTFGLVVMGCGFVLAGALAIATNMSMLWFVLVVGMMEIRPFAVWFVLFPLAIVIGTVLSPILFIFWGPHAVFAYWVGAYEVVVQD